jgi:glycosyltransferase involved in cell wall biosynthesis
MAQPKVAIVYPMQGFTGSVATVLWTAEALKDRYDVTLISGGATDLGRLNAFYGTHLKEGEVSILRAPMPPGLKNSARFVGLRWAFIDRFCRRVGPSFDLMINGYGPADFGPRGFHYIADFGFDGELSRTHNPLASGGRDWWYGPSPWRAAYRRLCETVSPTAGRQWEHNLTVANSNWTADLMRQRYGVDPVVIYPPVVGQFPDVPFENRQAGFVCLGQITPAKRALTIIEILDGVRRKGHDIHLHIAGELESNEYCRSLQALALRHRDWVFLEGNLFQTAKVDLISRHRFGIHACLMEAFGIAVAEMVKGGCIVFVPNGGGQVEIVNHPALIYENEADAVEKIDAVLTCEAEQETLRAHLRQGSRRFSQEVFQAQVRQLVEGLLKEPM